MKKREEDRKKEEKELEQLKWGRGLSQFEQYEARCKEEEEMKSQPFARSKDDEKMNKLLKEVIRPDGFY